MKRCTLLWLGVIVLALSAELATAQPPGGGQRGPSRRPGGPGGPEARGPARGMRPPQMPLMTALDADKNGEISAKEIENAVAALKKLDKNNDGKLTREELRPQFGGPGRGGPGGPGGPGRGGPGGGNFVERLMGFDKNKDGKVTKEELPEQMQRILERADANEDGAIDKAEAEKMAEQFRSREGGAQRGGGRGGRPGGAGGRPGGAGGDRPQRPSRPPRPDDN